MIPLWWQSPAEKKRIFQEKQLLFQFNDKDSGGGILEASPMEKRPARRPIDYSDKSEVEKLPTNHLLDAWGQLKSAQEKSTHSIHQQKTTGYDLYIREQEALQNTPLSPEQTNEHIHGINEEQSENETYNAQFEIHKALYGETDFQDEMGEPLSNRLDVPIVRQWETGEHQQQKQENPWFRIAIEDPRVRNLPPERQVPLIKKFIENRNRENEAKGTGGYATMEFDENAAGEVLKRGGTIAFRDKENRILILGMGPPNGENPHVQYVLDEHPHDEKNGEKAPSGLNGIQKKGDEQEYENCQISRNIFAGISSTRFSGMVQKGPPKSHGEIRNIPSPKSKEVSHQEAKQTPKTGEIPTADQWEVRLRTDPVIQESVKNVTGKGKDKKTTEEMYHLLLHFKLNDHLFSAPNEEKAEEIFTETDIAPINKALNRAFQLERSDIQFFNYRRENLDKGVQARLERLKSQEDGKPKDEKNEKIASEIEKLIWNPETNFQYDDLRNFVLFQKSGNGTFLERILINRGMESKTENEDEDSSAKN